MEYGIHQLLLNTSPNCLFNKLLSKLSTSTLRYSSSTYFPYFSVYVFVTRETTNVASFKSSFAPHEMSSSSKQCVPKSFLGGVRFVICAYVFFFSRCCFFSPPFPPPPPKEEEEDERVFRSSSSNSSLNNSSPPKLLLVSSSPFLAAAFVAAL
jgi:hypothetical protein